MLTACDRAADLARAEEWCRIAEDFARRHCPHPNPFAATCRTIYGGVLTATGRWPEADEVLAGALRTFESGHRAMRVDALIRLADLRLRQGRLEEARQFLQGYEDHPEAARPVAALSLEEGQPAVATALLQRRLRQLGPETLQAVPLLMLLVAAQVAQGDVAEARATADRLAALADSSRSPAIAGAAELAAARISGAAGGDPVPHLEAALHRFFQVGMPLELAQTRLELARALVGREPPVAAAEARAALTAFEGLGATRDADAAARVLRQLDAGGRRGPKGYGVLTRRQQEVLELLGLGLRNEQIAGRLYISRRTAEHHVATILSKLGLATRAEAAAYAARPRPEEIRTALGSFADVG